MSTMNTFCEHRMNNVATHDMKERGKRIPFRPPLRPYDKDHDFSKPEKFHWRVMMKCIL